MNLVPPCGYQGGKRRYADIIAKKMISFGKRRYCDFGCGSGAVTLALINNGIKPEMITAADAGLWGMFWNEIGLGVFDLKEFTGTLNAALSQDPRKVKSWIEENIATQPPTSVRFLILQAAAYGSSAVWHDGSVWRRGGGFRGYSARGYWEPTASSREKKPRGTIFAPTKIVSSLEQISANAVGLDGKQCFVENLPSDNDSVIYVDPPYKGTDGYGYSMDLKTIINRHRPIIVSEGFSIPGTHESIRLENRKGGSLLGISDSKSPEFINVWK